MVRAMVVGLLLAATAVAHAAPISYAGPPVPIPDGQDSSGTNPGTPASAPIAVSGFTEPVSKVTLSIDGTACTNAFGATTVGIDHSFVNDLRISLRSPSGTEVVVIRNTDGSGNNFCQVLLDDDSTGPSIQSVVSTQAPFTGTYTPNAPLSAFIGEPANGTWTLLAQDFASGDTGTIRAWSIDITAAPPPPPPPAPASIPTVSQWGLLFLSVLAGLAGLRQVRRRGT